MGRTISLAEYKSLVDHGARMKAQRDEARQERDEALTRIANAVKVARSWHGLQAVADEIVAVLEDRYDQISVTAAAAIAGEVPALPGTSGVSAHAMRPDPLDGAEDAAYAAARKARGLPAVDPDPDYTDERRYQVTAAPGDAAQCPICEVWVYVAAGPFDEEGDGKSLAAFNHWKRAHATAEERADADARVAVRFPYFPANERGVWAVIEGDLPRSLR